MAHDEGAPEKPALAEEVLATNPDRAMRLLCARALMHAERLARAEAEARTVAEDRSASAATRADAYCTLTDVLNRAGRWDDAHTELNAWQDIRSGDARLGAWRTRVGNRRIQIARRTSDRPGASRRTRSRS